MPYQAGRAGRGTIRPREFHVVADAFPLADQGEPFERLVESIRQHGLRVPIVLSQEGKIVDGRRRYLACQELGIEPNTVRLGPQDSPGLAAAELNCCRRDLDEQQRIQAFEVLYPYVEAEALARKRTGTLAPRGARVGKTAKLLGDALGLSERTVERLRAVWTKGSPELRETVKAGLLPVYTAAELSDLPAETQRAVAAAPDPKAAARLAIEQSRAGDDWEPPPPDEPPQPPDHSQGPVDAAGQVIPARLIGVFEATGALSRLSWLVRELNRALHDACTKSIGAYLPRQEIEAALKTVGYAVRAAKPWAVCHRCGGDGCELCLRQGWMTRERWKITGGPRVDASAVPEGGADGHP